MYGCNHNLSCLSGSINRVGKGLFGSITRIGNTPEYNELRGHINRVGKGLNAEVYRLGKPPMGAVSKIGMGLKGNVNLVCSVGKVLYLRVNPDVVWLTPDMLSGEFDIYSNVVWKID